MFENVHLEGMYTRPSSPVSSVVLLKVSVKVLDAAMNCKWLQVCRRHRVMNCKGLNLCRRHEKGMRKAEPNNLLPQNTSNISSNTNASTRSSSGRSSKRNSSCSSLDGSRGTASTRLSSNRQKNVLL